MLRVRRQGLTFGDVLLIPRYSRVVSRTAVDTSSCLSPSITLKIPIVSANMDTVTESEMAIAMARSGGIGVIHRFMTIEQQVQQVERVKREKGFMVENPRSIKPGATVSDSRISMDAWGVGSLLVIDEEGTFLGLLTQRDVLLAPDESVPISSLMTTKDKLITANSGIGQDEAALILHQHRLEKLPIMDDDGNLVGLITAQDLTYQQKHPEATMDDYGRLRVGAAVGVQRDEMSRVERLVEAGADILVVDIAHGHSELCVNMVKEIRHRFPGQQIIAGNVATAEGARDLADAGADAVKVGVGPGSICTTRIVTGFGVPQLTAIADCAEGVSGLGRDIPIVADGGIQTSGDLVKALAAGASTVMVGSLLAGCEEAPGATIIRGGMKYKLVRGMASVGASVHRPDKAESDPSSVVPEGVDALVPYRGNVEEILYQLNGGLRSGLSYGGATTVEELQKTAEFVEISQAGVKESNFHDVEGAG